MMAKSRKPAQTLAETAYNTLRADLLACRLIPGEDIKINELGARLTINPIAIREALTRLTAEGLVKSEAQKGFRVAPISEAELQDLTMVRIEIESFCLRNAIQTGGVEWESGIVAALHRLLRTPVRVAADPDRNSDEWVRNHRLFHEALTGDCGSPLLFDIRANLFAKAERYRRLSVPLAEFDRDLDGEHKALAQAALARDVQLATFHMSRHLKMTASILIQNVTSFNMVRSANERELHTTC